MVTTPTKPGIREADLVRLPTPSWESPQNPSGSSNFLEPPLQGTSHPAGRDALQALLAFSAMHQQIRRRRALGRPHIDFEAVASLKKTSKLETEFADEEQFVLDEVLQLVAERAIAITGADGLAIALAENDAIVLRASAGTIKPDVGSRIRRDSDFSGACFRTAQIIRCDDTETDDRVNLYACRQLGARSMAAVPLCGRRRVIGLLQAFSAEPFGFNDSDLASLEMLAELIIAALKPEDEDRFAQSAAAAELELASITTPHAADPAARQTFFWHSGSNEAAAGGIDARSEATIPLSLADKQNARSAPVAKKENVAKTAVTPLGEQKVENPALTSGISAEALPQQKTTSAASSTSSTSRSTTAPPGIALVFLLVTAAGLLGGGLWWKLKNGGFSETSRMVAAPSRSEAANGSAPSSIPQSSLSSSAPATLPAAADTSNSNASSSDDIGNSAEAETGDATSGEPSKMPRITGIRHWSSADSSTVVLDLEDQVQYEAHRLSDPDRIYFDLHDTVLASELGGKTIDIGDALLARVRVAQPLAGLTRLVLETKANANYSVSLEPNPYRLVVQLTKPGAAPKAQVDLFPGASGAEKNKLTFVIPPPTKEDLQLRAQVAKLRIVVDAGHGGWDLGTVGRRGLLEKDLVLEIAQRLGKLLESRLGADVILTRNDDNYIPLDERAGMANQARADLFVSVHANYSDLPSARGVETYYTNLFASPSAKELEVRPAAMSKAPVPTLLSAAELRDRIEQSRRLAASVQRSLYGTLATENPGLRDRGVKEASYVVLTETAMPGILAEVSFVSSPTDEQKLRSNGYREQIAEALYRGIARYAANSKSVKMARAGR